LKVASEPFFHSNGKKFERGAILLPVASQETAKDQLEYLIDQILHQDGIDLHAFHTGLDYRGVSLGSRSFLPFKKPTLALLVGDGVSPTDAGEIWHLLDTRFQVPITLLPVQLLDRAPLAPYTTLIIPSTTGGFRVSESAKEKIKDWIQRGGVVIGLEHAVGWLTTAGLGKFDMKKKPEKKEIPIARAYGDIDAYAGAQVTSGAILEAHADLSHPLLYGYDKAQIPVFKSNNLFMEQSKGPYSNPIVFTSSPLLSGYISSENYTLAKESAMAGVSTLGQGRVIGFTDNVCFRAFWLGSNKMLMNAIFYGALINAASAR
jgi:hypothetical protein